MAELPNVPAPEATLPVSRWIARVMLAVILAEGIWGLLVSLTRDLIMPFLSRQMGGDPQSPLYPGKGDYNFPGVFTALLELCFAGIAAAVLYAWANRGIKVTRVKMVTVKKVAAPAASKSLSIAPAPSQAVPTPAAPAPAIQSAPAPAVQSAPVRQAAAPPPPVPVAQSKPVTAAPPPPPKPTKPQGPKEVYYNIVGEPINPTEEE